MHIDGMAAEAAMHLIAGHERRAARGRRQRLLSSDRDDHDGHDLRGAGDAVHRRVALAGSEE